MSIGLPSRVDEIQLRERNFYIKRDDLIDPCLSGNKYRKLYSLLHTPFKTYNKIISYGGGQSNAMYSISCLCKKKGWEFHYYTKNLPKILKSSVDGNLELAIKRGMIVHEVAHEEFYEKVEELHSIKEEKTLVVSQGGADEIAAEGIKVLADEINLWKKDKGIKKLSVVLPSGTGSTSVYLASFLDKDISLYTVVLVSDEEFQIKQWKRLSEGPYPSVIPSPKQRFASLYDEHLQMHEELKSETGIEFDLIYAPKTWLNLLKYQHEIEGEIMYIHTGGVSGNETMLQRYLHKKSKKR